MVWWVSFSDGAPPRLCERFYYKPLTAGRVSGLLSGALWWLVAHELELQLDWHVLFKLAPPQLTYAPALSR